SGSPAPSAKPDAPPAGTQPLIYEVKAGDTLSGISLAVFGTSTRWKELLDANKDVLAKPEALRAGMELKIPDGGKLPAATDPKKADPKAKTAQTPAKKPDPNKKKVL